MINETDLMPSTHVAGIYIIYVVASIQYIYIYILLREFYIYLYCLARVVRHDYIGQIYIIIYLCAQAGIWIPCFYQMKL